MAAPAKQTSAPTDRTVDVRTIDGKAGGKVDLVGGIFGIEPNTAVMHQVVTAQLAAARAGTHSTKGRAEVRGGGSKPWRQKGTGRSRQGSIRSPQWAGGGVAHGPKPRDYTQRTPKKMVRLALRSALSDRATDDKVLVVDAWAFDNPRTKSAKAALDALGIAAHERALLVLDRDDDVAWKSFRNLAGERRVQAIEASQLNAYEVLVADWVVFTTATLEAVTDRLQHGRASDAGASGTTSSSAPDIAPSGAAPEAPSTDEAPPADASASGGAGSESQSDSSPKGGDDE